MIFMMNYSCEVTTFFGVYKILINRAINQNSNSISKNIMYLYRFKRSLSILSFKRNVNYIKKNIANKNKKIKSFEI